MNNLLTKLKKGTGQFGGYLIGLGFIASLSIFGYQGLHWIQNGEWLPLPLYKAIYYFDIDLYFVLNMEWQDAKKIVIWILELPLALVVLILSSTIGYILLQLLED